MEAAALSSSSSLFYSHTSNPSPLLPSLSSLPQSQSSPLYFAPHKPCYSPSLPRLRVSNASPDFSAPRSFLNSAAKTVLLTAAAAFLVGKFPQSPARAHHPPPVTISDEETTGSAATEALPSPLSRLLETNADAANALKALLQQKLDANEDTEALRMLEKLVLAQPAVPDWKLLRARLLNEMGRVEDARRAFEEILQENPLSAEALFENALLMDQRGEGRGVIRRLEEALSMAESEKKANEARNVKLMIAQVEFLQKNVEEALRRYDELMKEDPSDYRPYFCKGMIYSLSDRNAEAKAEFAKYKERAPKKFEVEGFLRTPLSRMKLFGTDDPQKK